MKLDRPLARVRRASAFFALWTAGAASAGCAKEELPPVITPVASAKVAEAKAIPAAPKTSRLAYPKVAERSVTVTYFGKEVKEPYQWLENGKDPEVQKLTDAQNALARGVLDGLEGRAKIKARVAELLGQKTRETMEIKRSGTAWLALQEEPPKQQPFLVVRASLEEGAAARTLVDPNVYDPTGKTTIDWFVPSRDGKWVAVSMSSGGSESGDVHVFDVATGKEKFEVVTRVHGGTAGGSLAWNAGGTGFFYTRYPRKGERPEKDQDFYQQVYFHELGKKPEDDKYAIGKDFPRIAEVELETSDDGKWILAQVANGDGGEVEHHMLVGKDWVRLSTFADKWTHASFGKDGSLYVMSRKDAPRGKMLRLTKPGDPKSAETIVPEGDGVIEQFVATGDTLFLVELVGGPSRLRAVPTRGKGKPEEIGILPVSSIDQIVRDGNDVVFKNQSYLLPSSYFRYSAKDKKVTKTALGTPTTIDMSDTEVVRESCISKDGTSVPLNVLRKKGVTLDKNRPTLLTGYGGYNVSRKPRLRPLTRLWLDRGGVFAEANLRGGGELGEAWHLAGNLTKKQNVFDDFHACAKLLVEKGYTRPEKLAAMGGSNGGLLMGATVVQHPEAFRAVVSRVGIYDMLRVELTPNGAFNVTEYGTVKNEDQFRALLAYSPLHNAKDGVAYPAVLFTTGANDPRVDPFHSRKMVARLQAATSSDRPILLRASGDTGHGMGTPLAAEIEESADIYTFLFHELGE
jgi:prolyl oligopeptidase